MLRIIGRSRSDIASRFALKRLTRAALSCGALLLSFSITTHVSAQVTGWRGDGSGRWPHSNPPVTWDGATAQNILWKSKVGKGQSTPVVVDDRVFVTAEPDKLICLNAHNGKIVWQLENTAVALGLTIKPDDKPPAAGCGYSAATPVTDGKLIYVCYGNGVVTACDLDGHRRWARYVDLPLTTQYGRSASPLLAGGKLLITLSSLLALDPETGKTLWQADKSEAAYGTPAIARIGNVDVALTPAGACVRISDGTILARKLGELTYGSPIVQGAVAYYAGPLTTAVALPKTAGDSFAPSFLWKSEAVEGEMFASPLWHDGQLYCVTNEGMLYVLNATTGAMIYTKQLPIRSARGDAADPANIYPSLTLAGANILISNDVGETLVLAPGKDYRELGINRLGKGSGACPVPHGSTLLLRGASTLFCIGAAEK